MKIIKKPALLLAVIVVLAVLAGCSMLEGMLALPDITIRVELFQAALNTPIRDAELIAANFAPYPETAYADQILENSFWDTQFDPDYTYEFEVVSTLDVEAVEATMTATLRSTGTVENPVDVTFKMYKDPSGDWLIEEYHEGSNAVVKLINAK